MWDYHIHTCFLLLEPEKNASVSRLVLVLARTEVLPVVHSLVKEWAIIVPFV